MNKKGQISLDFLFALILLFIFAAALQNFVVLVYNQKTELGLKYQAQSLALGINGAENAKQILNTPDTNSIVQITIPTFKSENYGLAACRVQIRPSLGSSVMFTLLTDAGQIPIDQNVTNPFNFTSDAICGGNLNV